MNRVSPATVGGMALNVRFLQKAGVPYEIEQQVCQACARVLDEKPVKRAAA